MRILLITETYSCTDPYAITEMEDIAVGIDLGTCYSCSGKVDYNKFNNFNIILTGSTKQLPSIVAFKENDVIESYELVEIKR